MIKKILALVAMSAAVASAQASVLLTQNFNSIPADWIQTKAGTAGGAIPAAWFQGDQTQFSAHGVDANGYLASNFNTAPVGGTLDNWLISPVFSTEFAVSVSVWMRAMNDDGFSDTAAFGFSTGSSAIADFVVNPVFTVAKDGWTLYNVTMAAQGAGSTGRFAIEYTGLADFSNYIGVDDLGIETIPEPASIFIMGAGVFGLVAARRRRQPA
jgi:hypothetical protein